MRGSLELLHVSTGETYRVERSDLKGAVMRQQRYGEAAELSVTHE